MQTFTLPQEELRRRLDILTKIERVSLNVLCDFLDINRSNLVAFQQGRRATGQSIALQLSDFFHKWDLGQYAVERTGRSSRIVPADAQRPLLHGQVTIATAGPRLRWKTLPEILGFDAWQPGKERKRPSGRRAAYSRSTAV